MASKNHRHKYHYINLGKKDSPRFVYACSLSDCSHHIPAHQEKAVIGKGSYCWECGNEMIISKDIFRKKTRKPRCWECRGIANPLKKDKKVVAEPEKFNDAINLILQMRK